MVRYCQEIADAYNIQIIITNSDLLDNTLELEELLKQVPDDISESSSTPEQPIVSATDIQMLQDRLNQLKK